MAWRAHCETHGFKGRRRRFWTLAIRDLLRHERDTGCALPTHLEET